jgi:hypothetical protein
VHDLAWMPTLLTTFLTTIPALLAAGAFVAAVLPRFTPRAAWGCAASIGLAGIAV